MVFLGIGLGFLRLGAILCIVPRFLTIVADGPGHTIVKSKEFEDVVPGGGSLSLLASVVDGVVGSVVLIIVRTLARDNGLEPFLLFGGHGGGTDLNHLCSGCQSAG